MIEDTMTLLSLLGRIMRYFLLRPETLFLLCISLALWSYFFHTDEVKTIVKSSRDAVKMVKGKVAEMMQNERFGGLDVLDAEFAKTWELKSHNVAVYSIQGRRDHMEDRYDVLADVINKTHPSIFGIFDGHGGEAAADYAKAHLPEALRQQLLTYERERERNREKDKEKNGKTEGMSYPSILEQQILMLDREMLEKLSATYNEAGGFISFNGSWRVQGILAMSRSLGDYTLKNLNVVIPDPDVLSFDLNKLQPEFMILASDGLWDTFSNEEAVRFVRERLDEPHFGAKSIVLQSYYRGCPDNITVMVVKFKGKTGAQ
ncbi:protein phosphatase, Mg2+/Mn2+ dependent, 1Lb isoform X2 [Phyllopteryx taeniolatus]|uniref:protein phosphatase, Mg2+/Mn2+ dependent, 1Lb isoform X2 n=1 Tax=Phyllopteryx taeniolatus TaxID=161469 RepID=UPI002AD51C35|nr:protein phosphatase, Mg2+/Mn2+ dependent, 1Lb isoform X2 [Phyllopteryx taeniolatus]